MVKKVSISNAINSGVDRQNKEEGVGDISDTSNLLAWLITLEELKKCFTSR